MVKSATLLVVDDLKISKNFYENILGLEISEELETAIKFKLGDHIILMFEGGHHAVEYDHGINANSTLIFNTQNLDSEIEKLKSRVEMAERQVRNYSSRHSELRGEISFFIF